MFVTFCLVSNFIQQLSIYLVLVPSGGGHCAGVDIVLGDTVLGDMVLGTQCWGYCAEGHSVEGTLFWGMWCWGHCARGHSPGGHCAGDTVMELLCWEALLGTLLGTQCWGIMVLGTLLVDTVLGTLCWEILCWGHCWGTWYWRCCARGHSAGGHSAGEHGAGDAVLGDIVLGTLLGTLCWETLLGTLRWGTWCWRRCARGHGAGGGDTVLGEGTLPCGSTVTGERRWGGLPASAGRAVGSASAAWQGRGWRRARQGDSRARLGGLGPYALRPEASLSAQPLTSCRRSRILDPLGHSPPPHWVSWGLQSPRRHVSGEVAPPGRTSDRGSP